MMNDTLPKELRLFARKATFRDCWIIGMNLRPDDREELRRLHPHWWGRRFPVLVVLASWLRSAVSIVWHHPDMPDTPVGIGGVCPDGVIWSLFRRGFPNGHYEKAAILRLTRASLRWFAEVAHNKGNTFLYNATLSKNRHILRWLGSCGAKFTALTLPHAPQENVTLFWFVAEELIWPKNKPKR